MAGASAKLGTVLVGLAAWCSGVAALDEVESVHVAFCAECKADMDWKSAGLYHSFHTSGMRGRITRLLACSEEQLAKYPKEALEMGPTYVHRNYRTHPRVPNDHSGSYNKAASIMHFMQDVHFEETFVLYLDADMLIRRPIVPSALGAKKGTVVSEHVMYLENGVDNGLVEQFSPHATGKPAPVGWYHLFHRDDIARIAPLWLHYCERMRTEPERYWAQYGKIPKDIPTGDAFVRSGGIPWIAEMYGYVIAAAEVGVEHILTHGAVKYAEWPEDHLGKPDWIADPYILHNGIGCTVPASPGSPAYRFDKGAVRVDPARGCEAAPAAAPGAPHVAGRAIGVPQRYAARPPPFERENGEERPYNQQLCIWAANLLNNAFCGLYRAQCAQGLPGRPPLEECPVQYETAAGLPAVGAYQRGGARACEDRNKAACPGWAHAGECRRNAGFMSEECPKSCGACVSVPPLDRSPERTFNGSLGAHVIVAKEGAPAEAAAPHAPKVVEGAAAAKAGAEAAKAAAAAAGAPAAERSAPPAPEAARSESPAPAVARSESPSPEAARSEPPAQFAPPADTREPSISGEGSSGAAAERGARPRGAAGAAALGALGAVDRARLKARDALAQRQHIAAAVALGAAAGRGAAAAAGALKSSLTAPARSVAAGGGGGGAAAGGDAEVEGTLHRIWQQMAITWGGALACVCCCLSARALQVAMRRRSRGRKKRDLLGKHSV